MYRIKFIYFHSGRILGFIRFLVLLGALLGLWIRHFMGVPTFLWTCTTDALRPLWCRLRPPSLPTSFMFDFLNFLKPSPRPAACPHSTSAGTPATTTRPSSGPIATGAPPLACCCVAPLPAWCLSFGGIFPVLCEEALFTSGGWGHRQTRPVKIYRLVAKGTTEDKIYRRQLQKIWLFSRVVDDKVWHSGRSQYA